MARAAVKTRRAKVAEVEAGSSPIVQECVGIALIGAALLLGLALGSFSPVDPVFEAEPVQNRAGVVGASAAALLFGTMGMGAIVVVAALAFLGGRLVLGIGLPKLAARFWVGVPLLLVSVATLPPLLAEASPGLLAGAPAGWLGRTLGGTQSLLVGAWGALLLNGVLATIGVLSLTGVSTGTALRAVGVVLGWLGGLLVALVTQIFDAVRSLAGELRRGTLELVGGVQRGFRSLGVWREQRRRVEQRERLDRRSRAGSPRWSSRRSALKSSDQ
jgi:hypothetical protein